MKEILFYIIDKKEDRYICVQDESEHGYGGYSVEKGRLSYS